MSEPKSTAIIQLHILRSTANETFIQEIYLRPLLKAPSDGDCRKSGNCHAVALQFGLMRSDESDKLKIMNTDMRMWVSDEKPKCIKSCLGWLEVEIGMLGSDV